MQLSPPHMLRGFALGSGIAILLLRPPPLQAQTPIPNTNTAIESIADTAQNLGALGFAVVCLGIALVILIIGILVFFWKAISPLLTAITASTKSRDEAAKAEREAREEQQEASSTHLKIFDERERDTQALRTRQAEAMESLGKSMERMANTMNESDERSEEGRTRAVTTINAHVDEKASELHTEIEAVKTALEKAASKDDIEPIIGKLDEIMTRLPKTGPLPPLPPESELPDANVQPADTPAPEPPS